MDDARRPLSWRFRGARQCLVTAEGISLDHAAESGEMVAWPLALAIWAEAVIGGGGSDPLPGSFFDQIGPEPPSPGLAVARRQHRDRRVVGMDDGGLQHMSADQFGQRRHPPGDMPHPVGQVARSISMPSRARMADCR